MNSDSSPSNPHVVLFPFMSKGHFIPHIHLAHLLLRRNIAVTIFTTPRNRPFVSASLSTAATATIVDLPFPQNIPQIPQNIENTDALSSVSLLSNFANGTRLKLPHFENALEKLLPISFLVSDGFLGWTLDSASKFGVPRLVMFGTNQYIFAMSRDSSQLFLRIEADDEVFTLPSFPWIKQTKNDFDTRSRDTDPKSANLEFITDIIHTTAKSYGELVNTFCELEPAFADYCGTMLLTVCRKSSAIEEGSNNNNDVLSVVDGCNNYISV